MGTMSNAGFILLSLQFLPGKTSRSRSFLCVSVSSFCFISPRSTFSHRQCRVISQLHHSPDLRCCISFRSFSSRDFWVNFIYRNGHRHSGSNLLLFSEKSNTICKTFFVMASLLTTTAVLGQAQVTSPKKMKTSNAESMDLDSNNKENKVRGSVPVLKFVKMTPKAHTPTKGSALAAGFDLKSAYAYTVPARGSCLVKTDIQIQLPRGTYGRVAPRSGLALKHKIDVGAGVIDEDYRGNVGVILFNHGDEDFPVAEGDRIAQLICEKIEYPDIVEVQDLENSERGEAGFGSTGTKS